MSLVIVTDGGVIQDVVTLEDNKSTYVVVDYDVEDYNDKDVTKIKGIDGNESYAYIQEYPLDNSCQWELDCDTLRLIEKFRLERDETRTLEYLLKNK